MNYEIIKIDEGTWSIEDSGVRFFLLTGSEKALLVDTGMNLDGVREIARSLTDLPLEVINTHADRDHIHGNDEFDSVMMHPAELVNYKAKSKEPAKVVPVWDGDEIDLGGRVLRVVTLPGHTPGSLTVLDESRRCIYGGDPIGLGIGEFLMAIINFIVIALVLFLVVKAMNAVRRKQEEDAAPAEEPAEPEPSKEELLLAEIRDILKNK